MTFNKISAALALGITGTAMASTSAHQRERDYKQVYIESEKPNIVCVADEIELPSIDGKCFPPIKQDVRRTTYNGRTIVSLKQENTTIILGYEWSHFNGMTCTVACEEKDTKAIEETLKKNNISGPYQWMTKKP